MADRRAARQDALRAQLAQHDIPALLVTHLPNIRWLTGFTGSAALLLVTAERTVLVTDFRYATQAPREAGTVADVIVDRTNVWERMRRVVVSAGTGAVSYEGHVVTVRDAERIAAMVGGRATPRVDLVERLRQQKDDGEVASIRAAAALALDALREVLPTIRVGDLEIEIAARLEFALRRRGSEWHPFHTIVASGERSALPHASTSDRAVGRGEFLLVDFGAQVDGYCSDVTRTMMVGRAPDERQAEVYGTVREAQLRARSAIRPGMTGKEADALARDLIAARGHGDAFGHSLGHGIGLEVHEAPRVAATSDAQLPVGAVVTVEPGIYLPGWGGVRLEDDVWLAPDGPVLLTDGATELLVLDQ